MVIDVVNLAQKLSLVREHWSPKIVGEIGEMHVKLAKLQGEFVWHHHEHEDELFLVLSGTLVIQLRDGDLSIGEGEFVVIPKGVEHRPVAESEVHVLLLEPKSTVNTGTAGGDRTVTPAWI